MRNPNFQIYYAYLTIIYCYTVISTIHRGYFLFQQKIPSRDFKKYLGGSYWARTSDLTNVNRTL